LKTVKKLALVFFEPQRHRHMLSHVDLYNDRETQHAYCLHQVATLCCISPHLELKTVTTHILERAAPVKPESRLQVVPAVVIVPQELVI
jgi:hypothetical protein